MPLAALVAISVTMFAATAKHAPSPRWEPGLDAPQLFAPGIVSTRDYERDGTFTPDGTEFYFTKRTIWPYHLTICVTRLHNGRWSEPEVAPFSGQYDDVSPFATFDGSAIWFASRRSVDGRRHTDFDLWRVHREGTGWGTPQRLPAPINTSASELSPSLTRSGVLYFTSIGATYRIVRAAPAGGSWSVPKVVSDTTQNGWFETTAFVDPGEQRLFEAIVGRADALHTAENIYPRADLYVRLREGAGWSAPRHLPAPINSPAEEGSPFLSPDGRTLYFMSERGPLTEHGGPRLTYAAFERMLHAPGNGLGDLYRVDARRASPEP